MSYPRIPPRPSRAGIGLGQVIWVERWTFGQLHGKEKQPTEACGGTIIRLLDRALKDRWLPHLGLVSGVDTTIFSGLQLIDVLPELEVLAEYVLDEEERRDLEDVLGLAREVMDRPGMAYLVSRGTSNNLRGTCRQSDLVPTFRSTGSDRRNLHAPGR
jgi:hypothetical protein